MTDREAYIALNLAEGVGPITVGRLVAFAGTPSGVYRCDAAQLRQVHRVGEKIAASVLSVTPERVARELALAESMDATVVTQADTGYPSPLRAVPTPPLALYIRGQWRERDARGVAIVGTRRPTQYGMNTARKMGFSLGRAGVTVVSGLARGIDTVAHQGALSAGGRTLAVVGCGLCHMYPEENRELADEIAGQGAVMSELPMERKPDKTTFPMRNRIVSGLSCGVVVVEAGKRSGAIITATAAGEQGVPVHAVPGRIDSFASQGTNQLLRDGAQVVTSIDDVVDAFGVLLVTDNLAKPQRQPMGDLADDERSLLECLGSEPMDVDELIRASDLSTARINTLLVTLELKRLVHMLPGRRIERM